MAAPMIHFLFMLSQDGIIYQDETTWNKPQLLNDEQYNLSRLVGMEAATAQ
jgi:hypothetical protein